jgi:hypothetical protein
MYIGTPFWKKQKKQKTKRHERFQEIKLEKAGMIAEGDQTQARYKKLVETFWQTLHPRRQPQKSTVVFWSLDHLAVGSFAVMAADNMAVI